MKRTAYILFCIIVLALLGCEIPQTLRPLRLYDLESGATIEVFLKRTTPNSGKLVSRPMNGEEFTGELFLGSNSHMYSTGYSRAQSEFRSLTIPTEKPSSLAETYGIGKEAQTKPEGTAMLVGNKGTTIEIIFYHISPDMESADGVARDNHGKQYRVFLSVER